MNLVTNFTFFPRTYGLLRNGFSRTLQPYQSIGKRNPFRSLSSQVPGSGKAGHAPTKLEKYYLVWFKRYPSLEEIPATVSANTIEKVRNLARIRINLILCFFTAIGAVGFALSGRKRAEQGESVQKANLEWHKSIAK